MPVNLKLQIEKNMLAIISLVVAIVALSYNSWRNELSEDNRNIRAAGFEIMREAATLQFYIDATTFAEMAKDEDVIQGWVSVNLIVSLSELISPTVNKRANNLKKVWTDHWSRLANDQSANQKITEANNLLTKEVKIHLASLK